MMDFFFFFVRCNLLKSLFILTFPKICRVSNLKLNSSEFSRDFQEIWPFHVQQPNLTSRDPVSYATITKELEAGRKKFKKARHIRYRFIKNIRILGRAIFYKAP